MVGIFFLFVRHTRRSKKDLFVKSQAANYLLLDFSPEGCPGYFTGINKIVVKLFG